MANGDWNNLKFKYTIGEYIEGIVVKQEPFGVFVDIGEMFDAIVLVPEMLESQ